MLRQLLLVCVLLVGSAAIAEEETGEFAAVFSYKRMHDLVAQFDDLQSDRRDRLGFFLRLRPRFVDATPKTITAYILRGEGQIPIEIDANGIVTMPMSPVLRGEEVLVVTNQPEGSLQLGLAIVVQRPSGRRFEYAEMAAAIEQVNFAMRAKARVAPKRVPQATGLILKFAPGNAVQLTVESAAGNLQLSADESGTIHLPYDETLLEENPRVSISRTPTIIYPWFGR